ncbi:hypothetical protein BGZ74_010837 [Mortierella antarctica]|nr:hypothetical protein BGZ74_010837 [Mortierella antarctica]
MFIRNILSVVVAIAACSSLQGVNASEASTDLTGATFKSAISQGTTFVKFYSPQCGHCINLAPFWEQAAVDHQSLRNTKDFKFAEVNCIIEGDVCDDNDVKGYPSMQLFNKGKKVQDYNGDRTTEALGSFAEEQAAEYDPKVTHADVSNEHGKVVVLTSKNYKETIQDGPWLVEYYAPWCGHCKALAPIYDELAVALKGKVNVAKVDCPANEDVCRSQGVRAYPTIKLHQHGTAVEFNKQRNLETMTTFALGALKSSVKPITLDELEGINAAQDVSFVFIHDKNTNSDDLKAIDKLSQTYYEQLPFYSSSDSEVAAHFGVSAPALIVQKDNRHYTFSGSLSNLGNVQAWILQVRVPIVTTVVNKNAKIVLNEPGWLLLGLFDPAKPATIGARRALIETALAYKQKGRSSPVGGKTLRFAMLDGTKWSKYIREAYNVEKLNLPVIVAVNNNEDLFYPVSEDGRRVGLDQASLEEYIKAIQEGSLEAQSTLSYTQKAFRQVQERVQSGASVISNHPFMAVGLAAAVVYGIVKKLGSSEQRYEGLTKSD